MIIVNLSRSPKKLLSAKFYRPDPNQQALGNPIKNITGTKPILTTNVLKELQAVHEPARICIVSPNFPKAIVNLLRRAIINHNETIPSTENRVVKVWKDPNHSEYVLAMLYPSKRLMDKNFHYDAIGGLGNPPVLAALVTLKSLQAHPRFLVNLEFEDGVSQDVKDLFTTVINVYNKLLEPKP